MSIEYDSVIAAVAGFLGNYTDLTVKADPFGKMKEFSTPVVAVSIEEAESTASGVGDYLGIFSDAETGVREIYGRYLEVSLGLDIYSPDNADFGAAACPKVFGQIVSAFSESTLPVKVKNIQCGKTEFDDVTRMYRCKVTAKCRCFMTAEIREDGEFTDYILKGVMIK
ncbi:MAG: hypothetical protein IJC91_06225 [Oscillospiraceae bacterium]|nr:hypothetical protein [Oscillospiraceae bacterium]